MNIFKNLDQKCRFSENLDQNPDFWKFYTKFGIFENFEKKKPGIFDNFDQTQDLKKKFHQNWDFILKFPIK